jgi:hypothetical protein
MEGRGIGPAFPLIHQLIIQNHPRRSEFIDPDDYHIF